MRNHWSFSTPVVLRGVSVSSESSVIGGVSEVRMMQRPVGHFQLELIYLILLYRRRRSGRAIRVCYQIRAAASDEGYFHFFAICHSGIQYRKIGTKSSSSYKFSNVPNFDFKSAPITHPPFARHSFRKIWNLHYQPQLLPPEEAHAEMTGSHRSLFLQKFRRF